MNPMVLERACAARLLVAISFHFDAARVCFFAEVLRSLAEFPVSAMHVTILTNTLEDDELDLLRRLCSEILTGKVTSIESHTNLSNPWHLTWCHKPMISKQFLGDSDDEYTHFIYLEGDIRLSFVNFCYFVEFREALRNYGLLPSFIRMEYRTAVAGFTTSDVFWPVYVPTQSHLLIGDLVFVNMPNPYNPFFIMDRELAAEYVQTPSFDREGSLSRCRWAVADRSAMGLCLENVPPPFQTRYVVPVSTQTDMVLPAARVSHLPDNYANNPHSPLGKVRVDSLFRGASRNGDWWPSSAAGATETLARSADTKSQDRYYLVSHHDTILSLDEAAQQFRHAPFGIAPLNLALELEGTRGHLVLLGDAPAKERKLSFGLPTGEIKLLSDSADADFQVQSFADGSVGLFIGELYVAADLDGIVRNDRTWCRAFEQFRLIRTETLDGLAILQRHSWISHSDGQIVTLAAQPIDFGRERPHESSALAATLGAGAIELRRDLVFGPARLSLVGRTRQLTFDQAIDPDLKSPLDVFITDRTGTKYGFSKYCVDEIAHDRVQA